MPSLRPSPHLRSLLRMRAAFPQGWTEGPALSGCWADGTLSLSTWDGASSETPRRSPGKDDGGREQGQSGELCVVQQYFRALLALYHVYLSSLHREAPRTYPWCKVYMPETPLLYLESTLSYKPTGDMSPLQNQKDQRVPMFLCISLLAGRGQPRVGEVQVLPWWRLLWAERAGSGPLPPMQPFLSL